MYKKIIAFILLLCVFLTLSSIVFADADGEYAVGYLQYTIKDGKATITHCDQYLTGELAIPSELSGCPVVAIGEQAFRKSALSKVIIPDSIHTIGKAAFLDAGVQEIVGADHVTSFGEYAFAYSGLLSISLPQNMTEIPNGLFMQTSFNDQVSFLLPSTITRIGDYAFYGTNGFAELVLPASLREIGDGAFAGTSPRNWENLILPEGLVSIGDGAFWRTATIKTLSLPSTLKECGSGKLAAFYGTNIETVTLAEGITALPHAMFLECRSLRSVLLPDSLTNLSADEFGFPNWLVTGHSYPSYYATLWDGFSDFTGGDIVPHSYDGMHKNPLLYLYANPGSFGAGFASEKGLPHEPKDAYILTEIQGEGDFLYRIYGGKAEIVGYTGAGGDVTIPATLGGYPSTVLAPYGLHDANTTYRNQTIRTLSLPETLCEIRDNAFVNCTALEAITLTGENITIGNSAFHSCTNLARIDGFENVISVGEGLFQNCRGLKVLPVLSVSITKIPANFADNTGILALDLPAQITEIGNSAFGNCNAMETLTLPEGLEIIGGSAFSGCESLKTVIIPDSVNTLGAEAFHGCKALRYVKVGNGITALGNESSFGVFTFCPALETVILPDSLTCIFQYEFYDGYYSRYMRRSYIERPKTLTIFANQDSYAADFANRNYIRRMPLITVLVNDEKVLFDALPFIEEKRTLVPFRAIFEALDATVAYNHETQTVTATRGTDVLTIVVGGKTLYNNEIPIPLEVPAVLIQDRLFVPLRAISEAWEYKVLWEDTTKTATIKK